MVPSSMPWHFLQLLIKTNMEQSKQSKAHLEQRVLIVHFVYFHVALLKGMEGPGQQRKGCVFDNKLECKYHTHTRKEILLCLFWVKRPYFLLIHKDNRFSRERGRG